MPMKPRWMRIARPVLELSGDVSRRDALKSSFSMAVVSLFFGATGCSSHHNSGSGSLCLNTCTSARDGECDDGGPNSDYGLCTYGTDCLDCGPRSRTTGTSVLCTNTCGWHGDGDCDDGGLDSDYGLCAYGTDCADCGPRSGTATLCTNTCGWDGDGDCDDGGVGSDYSVCAYGTDCTDCGPRSGSAYADYSDYSDVYSDYSDVYFDYSDVYSDYSDMYSDYSDVYSDYSDSGSLCTDTCDYQSDGVCDDGGPNALYSACDYGTDCTDCGPR